MYRFEKTQIFQLSYSNIRIKTKMKTILLFVFLKSITTTLLPCRWTQSVSSDFPLKFYLKQPVHGLCYYQVSQIRPISSESYTDYLIMIKGLREKRYQFSVIMCRTQNMLFQNNCSFVSDLEKMHIDRKGMFFIKNGSDLSAQQLQIQFLKHQVNSLKYQNKLSVENIIIQMTSKPKDKLSHSLYLGMLLPFIYLSVLLLQQRKQFLRGFEFLRQLIIIKIVSGSAECMIQNFEQEVLLTLTLFNYIGPVLYAVNFITIGFSIKKYLDYIYNGTLEFQNCQLTQLPSSNAQSDVEQKVSSSTTLKTVGSQLVNFCQNFKLKFSNQNEIVQRMFKSIIFVIVYFSLQTDYLLINTCAQSILFILLPAYLNLRDVSSGSQLKANKFDWCDGPNIRGRNTLLLPVETISLYFVLLAFKILTISVTCHQSILQLIVPFSLIVGVWIMIVMSLWTIVKSKREKNSRIIHRKKIILFNFKWIQYLRKLYQSHSYKFQEQYSDNHNLNCCICLQQLKSNQQEKFIETQCGHTFHVQCLCKWTKIKPICPVDRYNLNIQSLSSIYNQMVLDA